MCSTVHPTLATIEVGQITGSFVVPDYQRGYRWDPSNVTQLLDDIKESIERNDRSYYLQPVVVRRRGEEWELVDGQQRLTTLYLVSSYMQREGLQAAGPEYSIRYETRPESEEFLATLDVEQSRGNIDYYHLAAAYEAIGGWFAAQENPRYSAARLYFALHESVKVIWYEAPVDVDAATLFARLNIGRIPLTDAELVKALLLTRCNDGEGGALRAPEVAAQWDAIERDLREPEIWAFATGGSDEPTRIGLLLDSIAGGPTGRDRALFYTFEELKPQIESDPKKVWDAVLDIHSLVLSWFEDRDVFHKAGYLIARGARLADLVAESIPLTRSEFGRRLDERISDRLRLTETQFRDLTYSQAITGHALLLANVETIRRRNTRERYSFHEHSTGRWSLEHIHAQNADRLTKASEWASWLRLHRDVLATWPEQGTQNAELLEKLDHALDGELTQAAFRTLERSVLSAFSSEGSEEGAIDSIANLALLDGGTNSALGNSVFAVKRSVVLQRDRDGEYIPPCTRNAFLKYYSDAEGHQMHFWSELDRAAYLDALVDAVAPYLLEDAA